MGESANQSVKLEREPARLPGCGRGLGGCEEALRRGPGGGQEEGRAAKSRSDGRARREEFGAAWVGGPRVLLAHVYG